MKQVSKIVIKALGKSLLSTTLQLILVLVIAYMIQIFWPYIASVFGLKLITFSQSVALTIISGLLLSAGKIWSFDLIGSDSKAISVNINKVQAAEEVADTEK